ncbi:MAG: hypothetical protein EOP49_26250 [Sphingobacteriales bacterium]|nr:MAG: hypothetical protein EOP49_26250 [Sphingobacteriales bacterium]
MTFTIKSLDNINRFTMKILTVLICLVILFASCSSPKKAPAKPVTTVTKTDVLNGGTSYRNAVVLQVTTEREGVDEEYRWLRNLYPGYTLIRRSEVKRSPRYYHIIRIKTREGHLKDIYFDSTSFSRKK